MIKHKYKVNDKCICTYYNTFVTIIHCYSKTKAYRVRDSEIINWIVAESALRPISPLEELLFE